MSELSVACDSKFVPRGWRLVKRCFFVWISLSLRPERYGQEKRTSCINTHTLHVSRGTSSVHEQVQFYFHDCNVRNVTLKTQYWKRIIAGLYSIACKLLPILHATHSCWRSCLTVTVVCYFLKRFLVGLDLDINMHLWLWQSHCFYIPSRKIRLIWQPCCLCHIFVSENFFICVFWLSVFFFYRKEDCEIFMLSLCVQF